MSIFRGVSLFLLPSLKLTFSHLKMDGWNTIVSFWDFSYFRVGLLLVSGRETARLLE